MNHVGLKSQSRKPEQLGCWWSRGESEDCPLRTILLSILGFSQLLERDAVPELEAQETRGMRLFGAVEGWPFE